MFNLLILGNSINEVVTAVMHSGDEYWHNSSHNKNVVAFSSGVAVSAHKSPQPVSSARTPADSPLRPTHEGETCCNLTVVSTTHYYKGFEITK